MESRSHDNLAPLVPPIHRSTPFYAPDLPRPCTAATKIQTRNNGISTGSKNGNANQAASKAPMTNTPRAISPDPANTNTSRIAAQKNDTIVTRTPHPSAANFAGPTSLWPLTTTVISLDRNITHARRPRSRITSTIAMFFFVAIRPRCKDLRLHHGLQFLTMAHQDFYGAA